MSFLTHAANNNMLTILTARVILYFYKLLVISILFYTFTKYKSMLTNLTTG